MEALEIEGHADQEPLASGGGLAPQRELAEAEYLCDDAPRYHPTKPWKRMPYGTDGSRAAC